MSEHKYKVGDFFKHKTENIYCYISHLIKQEPPFEDQSYYKTIKSKRTEILFRKTNEGKLNRLYKKCEDSTKFDHDMMHKLKDIIDMMLKLNKTENLLFPEDDEDLI